MGTAIHKTILVIEDDAHIAEGLRLNLSLLGHIVHCAHDGPTGLTMYRDGRPDLVVLDIMLPGMDGLTILQRIREADDRVPVLILSAKAGAGDIVKGLSYGVDDYLAKPFNLEEFILRVERLLKRASWSEPVESLPDGGRYRFGDNWIDFETGAALGVDGELTLTELELRLLRLFTGRPGKPMSRAMLLESGWGLHPDTTSRSVDNFLVRFRKYFEPDPKNPRYFKSVRGIGYMFDPHPEYPF